MNLEVGTKIEPHPWSTYRWWSIVALVLTIQVGLIFWLGDQGPVPVRSTAVHLSLKIAGTATNEILALMDPTLFALPHRESFAGTAWLRVPDLGAQPFEWSEPPQWLELSEAQLGAAFHSFLATNQFTPPQALAQNEPEFAVAEVASSPAIPDGSTVRILGELTGRRLLTPFSLGAWTNAEMLTNSIVQVLIDAQGQPYYVTLLSQSGSAEADQFAIKQGWMARFEPLAQDGHKPATPPAGLSWGQIVFDWHTMPPAPTNRPAGP